VIIQAVIVLALGALLGILSFLAPLMGATTVIPPEVASSAVQVFSLISYFIPIGGLLPIVIFFGAADGALVAWRLAMRIKSFIPFFGN
jgi:hypothetical protein